MDGFHVSLAWSLSEPGKDTSNQVIEALMKSGGCGEGILGKGEKEGVKLQVDAVKVKIGNAVHIVELGNKTSEVVASKKRKAPHSAAQ